MLRIKTYDKTTKKLEICSDSINSNLIYMQGTGMLDIDDVEIFEGDIVEEDWPGGRNSFLKNTYIVQYDKDLAAFIAQHGARYLGEHPDLKIIGNIYEEVDGNPVWILENGCPVRNKTIKNELQNK